MRDHRRRARLTLLRISWFFGIMAMIGSGPVLSQSLDEVLGVRASTTSAGRDSQLKIDDLREETQDLLSQFKQVMKIVDGLKAYNRQQERLIEGQEQEIEELNVSIDQVTVIERQIGPLIERMIDNLEKFVELDAPFLVREREDRISFLRETLDRADVSVSEKFSQVLQAYQIENGYGTTIDAYTDTIEVQGSERQVDMLRWGRVILAFQTPDQAITGVWDKKAGDWQILDSEFRSGVRNGIRIARKTQTADIVLLPVPAPGE
ncbi:MAG: DUF3450 domain-containing protein [Pseudomonadales bacterium]|nr:DUF3450 domain-containing protein [Pseudomonadales bacterium]